MRTGRTAKAAKTAKSDLAGLIARYARTLHVVIGSGHHVASPLGAWLLLALCGPATDGDNRKAVTQALGCDVFLAATLAADLLATARPLVAAAAAVWNHPGAVDSQWLAGLPGTVETGDIPGQHELDEWARRHTFGLIEAFPIDVDDAVYVLLATALATKVSWDCPFELAPGSGLGESSPWAEQIAHVLRAPEHPSHSAFIAATAAAGDVAVHVGLARGGLLVASVAAAPDVAPADVIAVAHRLAIARARGQSVPQRSLFDLPLGDGPIWSLREEMSQARGGQRCAALLPAWSAFSKHDLADGRLGFAAAAMALGKGDPWQAKQAAMASYSKTGFEAGAVTAMAVRLSATLSAPGLSRTAELRFGHPYAVVAVTVNEHAGPDPWHGMPVFSAWVTDPRDAGAESSA